MNHSKRMRLATAVAAGGLTLLFGATGAGAQDPPGNNGTVKIDGVDFDTHPDNEPHVGCEFQVDFYNYDEGDLTADVRFYAIPPTTTVPGPDDELLLEDLDIFIGGDPAGGGDDDVDAERTYDLSDALAGITPHPVQGWHVRLDVNAEGSIGDDSKHKVFWVEQCVPTTTSSSTTSTSSTSTSSTSSTTSTTLPGETTTTLAGATTTVGGGSVPPQGPTTTAPTGALPRTGNDTLPLVALGGVLLGAGAGAGVLAKRLAANRGA